VDLTTSVAGIDLRSPIMTASGCGGDGRDLAAFCDLSALGAFVTSSVTRDGSGGRALPRFVETPAGILSAVGLPGAGVEAFLTDDLPWLLDNDVSTIVSIAGSTLGEYAELARGVGNVPGIAGVEVNLSAVEPAAGALKADLVRGFARDPVQAARAVAVARRETASEVPVFAKLWPGIASVVDLAAAVLQAGADAVVLPGSMPGLLLDPATLRPILGGGQGVLSGPATLAVGLYAVWEVRRALPHACIVGAGGIRSGSDVVAFLAAGADAVQVGSALLFDPSTASRVAAELSQELDARGAKRPHDIVAVAHTGGSA
jgi:dihydroorotate dehydrogenase (NAD+) catalytic subunit